MTTTTTIGRFHTGDVADVLCGEILQHAAHFTTGRACAECVARVEAAEHVIAAVESLSNMPVPGCGTITGYTRGCRCDECRAAAAAQRKAWREKQAARRVEVGGVLVAPDAVHGTEHAYTGLGCRCDRCRKWATGRARVRRQAGVSKQKGQSSE